MAVASGGSALALDTWECQHTGSLRACARREAPTACGERPVPAPRRRDGRRVRPMKPSVTKAVIPAAGLGTRFLPATKAQPKEMLPVVDKPAIQYVVEEAVR